MCHFVFHFVGYEGLGRLREFCMLYNFISFFYCKALYFASV